MKDSRFAVGSNQHRKKLKSGGFVPQAEADNVGPLVIPVREIPASHDIIEADSVDLDDFVTHPDWRVRADAASNPHLTLEQARFLADPDDQPEPVRASVAMSGKPGFAELVSRDPSPTVRSLAQMAWDVDPETDARLRRDASVSRIRHLLAS